MGGFAIFINASDEGLSRTSTNTLHLHVRRYWATFSAILYTVGFIFNTALTGLELLTATGYAMFVYCIVLITGCPTFAGPVRSAAAF